MTDLTALFQKYVHIIKEHDEDTNLPTNIKANYNELERYTLKDTFIKECHDLLRLLIELRKVLRCIESQYMSETDMTEAEKDDFDTELRLQFHQYVQKFRHLEKYEKQRQQIISDKMLSAQAHVVNFFQGTNSEKLSIFYHASNEFRSGVLQSLSMWLNIVSTQFTSMQQERLASQRKFEGLDFNSGFQSPQELNEMVSVSSVSQSRAIESTQDEVKHYEETISKLTQEQLQLLETEHEELLNQKNEQLKKVEKINKTIMDIVTIQNEISTNLQAQSQNINNILDHQDDIGINIKEGNKQLSKAKKAAGRTAKMTTYIAVILGIIILFLDYIG